MPIVDRKCQLAKRKWAWAEGKQEMGDRVEEPLGRLSPACWVDWFPVTSHCQRDLRQLTVSVWNTGGSDPPSPRRPTGSNIDVVLVFFQKAQTICTYSHTRHLHAHKYMYVYINIYICLLHVYNIVTTAN